MLEVLKIALSIYFAFGLAMALFFAWHVHDYLRHREERRNGIVVRNPSSLSEAVCRGTEKALLQEGGSLTRIPNGIIVSFIFIFSLIAGPAFIASYILKKILLRTMRKS